MTSQKKATSIKVDSDIMHRVETEAAKENRSMANYIETVLKKHFELLDQDQAKKASDKK